MADKINQTEGAVHSPETMDGMQEEVLKKVAAFSGVDVPLYFDDGKTPRILIGSATIEPDGEVRMQIDREDYDPLPPEPGDLEMSIQPKPDIEELWAKRRTY